MPITIACTKCGIHHTNLLTGMCREHSFEMCDIPGTKIVDCWKHYGTLLDRSRGPLPAKLIREDGTWQLLFADGTKEETHHKAWGHGMFYKKTMEKIVRGLPFP